MKKVLPVLLLLSAVLSVEACKAQEADRGKANTNANVNRSANANNTNGTNSSTNANQGGNVNTTEGIAPGTRVNYEKDVQILINDQSGKCSIEVPSTYQSVRIKLNKGKIRWTVINNCEAAAGASVVIENFGKNNSRPFGGEECDNRFVFDPIGKGEEGHLVTRTGKVAGTFPYTIKVVNGSNTIAELDPEIIVGTFDSE